jgi:hypothetical protein
MCDALVRRFPVCALVCYNVPHKSVVIYIITVILATVYPTTVSRSSPSAYRNRFRKRTDRIFSTCAVKNGTRIDADSTDKNDQQSVFFRENPCPETLTLA